MPIGAAENAVTLEAGSQLAKAMGADAWAQGMHPEVPEVALVESPYQYNEYHGAAPASRAED